MEAYGSESCYYKSYMIMSSFNPLGVISCLHIYLLHSVTRKTV